MAVLAFDAETQRTVDSGALKMTNAILKAKKKKHPWDVVALIIDTWKKQNPKRWKSYVMDLGKLRESQKETFVGNKRFKGVSKDKETGGYLALRVDFPVWIMMAIRKVYNNNELSMDKEFFREFWKRFPEFRIMERT